MEQETRLIPDACGNDGARRTPLERHETAFIGLSWAPFVPNIDEHTYP